MTVTGWIQIVAVVVVLTGLTPLLGGYMARVYQGERVALTAILGPVERFAYRLCRVDGSDEQDWKQYAGSLLLFSAASWLVLYLVLRTKAIQPLNPQGFTHSGPWDLSFNTASSFVSNTSWQYYAGETTLSDFAQMAGITVASFTSCATWMAVAVAVIRGLSRRGTDRLGNFWVDLTRSTLYVLLPIAILASILLTATGVPQTVGHYLSAHGPTGLAQTIAIGPVASQEAIKLMSGDGGGFFHTNSAHPFENPTGISDLVEILLMLLIPAAFTATFGQMIGRRRQGWALYAAMLVMFLAGTAVLYGAETHATPAQHAAGLRHVANLEGKEQRFGAAGSALFVSAGTTSGDGGVNSAVESFTGLGAAVAMANMMTGEVIFGGPGSGLYGMLLLVILTVFIAGLMVGRTPEYLGK
jgi:K+-transporting ATPase ATPase A chain